MYLMIIGALFIGISVPMVLRRIPPNQFYGFRTRKTLSDSDIWYKANKYMGRDFIVAGAAIMIMGVGQLLVQGTSCPEGLVSVVIFLAMMNVPVVIVTVRSVIYLRKL